MNEEKALAYEKKRKAMEQRASMFRKADMDTSAGLYKLADQYGLKSEADRVLSQHQGEKTKEIFSGGFISDVFDVLNALQYGVVGVVKGKGFAEGVRTRQSFSDKDSLGANGAPGAIAGLVADIAFDPLTYLAPMTVIRKIPGAVKAGKAVKKATLGEMTTKEIALPDQKKTILKQELVGGIPAAKWIAEKLVYGFGVDPVYLRTIEEGVKNVGVANQAIIKMGKMLTSLSDDAMQKVLKIDPETGIISRSKLDDLQKALSEDEFKVIKTAWTELDNLGKEAVELGLLSQAKFEENLGSYIKNVYETYEKAEKATVKGAAGVGIKGIKSRKDLTREQREALGIIKDPAYLWTSSMAHLVRDVENAKVVKKINKLFGSAVEFDGSLPLPKGPRLEVTAGAKMAVKENIGDLNKLIRPLERELKKAFKDDKKLMSEIKSIRNEISGLSSRRSDEFFKVLNEGEVVSKVSKAKTTIQGVGKLPENLQSIGNDIKKFDTLEAALRSDAGVKLEKAFEEGALQQADKTFKTMQDFFDFVKNPVVKTGGKESEEVLAGNVDKLISLQKRIQTLSKKAKNLSEIDKKSLNNALINLEKNLNDVRFAKEDALGQLNELKLLDLSGKYVPADIHKLLTELSEPYHQNFGTKLIGAFKYNKVILNPATHARNIMSNVTLNWWKLGIGPWNAKLYATAVKETFKGGKWTDELVQSKVGYGANSFISQEMRQMLEMDELKQFAGGVGAKWKKMRDTIGDIYQNEENIAKVAAYIHHRKKGISIEESWKAAESATFNYAQVTPFIRKFRQSIWGMPFITFTVKATPVAVETALKNPQRISVFGKIKNAIEQQADIEETEREKASAPDWITNGFYVKLPFDDKYGRSAYFDLTYIIPFGDLVSGNFFDTQTKRSTGTKESIGESAISKSPVINLIKEISRNQDFSGRKIWQDSASEEEKLQDLFRHVAKTFLPPLAADQIPGGYNPQTGERATSGVLRTRESAEENQTRTPSQEFWKNLGMKIQPIDVEVQEAVQEWNKKKALQTLLLERNVMKQYVANYIPKDK